MVNSVTPIPNPPIASDTMAKARWLVPPLGLAGLRVGVEVIGLLLESSGSSKVQSVRSKKSDYFNVGGGGRIPE